MNILFSSSLGDYALLSCTKPIHQILVDFRLFLVTIIMLFIYLTYLHIVSTLSFPVTFVGFCSREFIVELCMHIGNLG